VGSAKGSRSCARSDEEVERERQQLAADRKKREIDEAIPFQEECRQRGGTGRGGF
jgi:hypothetical protein